MNLKGLFQPDVFPIKVTIVALSVMLTLDSIPPSEDIFEYDLMQGDKVSRSQESEGDGGCFIVYLNRRPTCPCLHFGSCWSL